MSSLFYPSNPGWGNAATLAKRRRRTTVRRTTAPTGSAYSIEGSASAAAQKIIDSMIAEVKRQQEEARASAMREAALEMAKGQAVAYGLQQLGISDRVQAAFQNAANSQASLAQGFSGRVRTDAAADAAAQQRALTGTGQEAAVRNQGENMGNVVYGTGGFIPSTELSSQAAAFGANAALQPGFATQFGQLAEAKRLADWATEAKGWGNKIADVIGKKPEIFQSLLGQERDWYNDQYARYKDRRDFDYQQLQDKLSLLVADKKMTLAQAEYELRKWEKMNPDPVKLQARTLANGQIQWYDPLTGKTVGNPSGPKKPPKTDTTKTASGAPKVAQTAYADSVASIAKDISNPTFFTSRLDAKTALKVKYGGKVTDYISLQQARQILMDAYWPAINAKGGGRKLKARLFKAITNLLRKQGFSVGKPSSGIKDEGAR